MVSVIVPNYNHARYLERRLDSIFSQDYPDFEVIILDDRSTDNSRDVIERYRHHPRLKLIEYNEQNSGSPFKQWKKGIGLAGGEYIWIAESDDFARPDFLSVMMPRFEDPDLAVAYCASFFADEQSNETGSEIRDVKVNETGWYFNKGTAECRDHLFSHPIIPNASAVVFRKRAAEKVDDEFMTFKVCGDWWFWISICLQGNIAYFATPLNYFRQSATSVSRSETHNQGIRKVFLLEYLRIASSLAKIVPVSFLKRNAFIFRYWVIVIRESFKKVIRLKRKELAEQLRRSWQLSFLFPLIFLYTFCFVIGNKLVNMLKRNKNAE